MMFLYNGKLEMIWVYVSMTVKFKTRVDLAASLSLKTFFSEVNLSSCSYIQEIRAITKAGNWGYFWLCQKKKKKKTKKGLEM